MKTTIALVILTFVSWNSAAACIPAGQHYAETQKINQHQGRINQLNAEVPQLNQTKQRVDTALPGYQDSVKICAISSDSLKNAEQAVGLTIETLGNVIVFDQILQRRLFKIIESANQAPDWSLSALLKNYAGKGRLSRDQRAQILAIATTLDLLSEKDQNWKAEERQWLQSVKGKLEAVQTLAARLQPLHQQIVFDIKNKEESCKRSTEQVATLNEQRANADKRLNEIAVEIAGHNALIAQSNGILYRREICEPPPTFSQMIRQSRFN